MLFRSYLEAAACGLRVIGGAGGGSGDAIPDRRVGDIVDPRDRDGLVEAVIRLVSDIKDRHQITRGNVVGHSDIAPARKRDPGELFPWGKLARLRLALPRPSRNLMDPHWTEPGFLIALERFGYDVSDPMAAIMAFQRRFRPELIDGEIDAECRMILLALLLPKPQGDE